MIPIYRAKKVDSDGYVEGLLCIRYDFDKETPRGNISDRKRFYFIQVDIEDKYYRDFDYHEINPSTLSIHFPDMIDSEGAKIFASLSEDGKGGDLLESEHSKFLATFRDNSFILVHEPTCRAEAEGECKTDILNKFSIGVYSLIVTGIQE